MKINLISTDNGVGLTQDVRLLSDYLSALGHQPRFADVQEPSPPADLNIHVELFDPMHLDTAPRHVGIFNLEWFRAEWVEFLPRFTQLWAKSAHAFEWYMEQGLDTATYTGFLSRDLNDPTVPRLPHVLHVRGQSQYKNTEAILEAYRRAGSHLPPLTIIASSPLELAPNVEQYVGMMTHAKLVELMNSHLFHLCPSQVEGWGHYITEGLSCKAIVITTDASPMHDHVMPSFGRLIEPSTSVRVQHVEHHTINPDAIIEALQEVAQLPDDQLSLMRAAARVSWRHRQDSFEITARRLLKQLA